jgi:hypothetical protein
MNDGWLVFRDLTPQKRIDTLQSVIEGGRQLFVLLSDSYIDNQQRHITRYAVPDSLCSSFISQLRSLQGNVTDNANNARVSRQTAKDCYPKSAHLTELLDQYKFKTKYFALHNSPAIAAEIVGANPDSAQIFGVLDDNGEQLKLFEYFQPRWSDRFCSINVPEGGSEVPVGFLAQQLSASEKLKPESTPNPVKKGSSIKSSSIHKHGWRRTTSQVTKQKRTDEMDQTEEKSIQEGLPRPLGGDRLTEKLYEFANEIGIDNVDPKGFTSWLGKRFTDFEVGHGSITYRQKNGEWADVNAASLRTRISRLRHAK